MAKIVTFGELMLRLAPNGYYRFFQNDQMQATFGGGEANVAVSLANYGMDSVYVTKLPKHAIGQAAVNSLRYFGVDPVSIARCRCGNAPIDIVVDRSAVVRSVGIHELVSNSDPRHVSSCKRSRIHAVRSV